MSTVYSAVIMTKKVSTIKPLNIREISKMTVSPIKSLMHYVYAVLLNV